MIPKECKRLAEVDFPIAVVSRHAAREKSIRHGHPSTLHLWWARRPLAACRAMLLGLLLPDPADESCPANFRDQAWRALERVGIRGTTGEDLRQGLLTFIGNFANWDLSAEPTHVEVARALVAAAHPGEPPLVVDPFAGGGSIPLEALRLGCDAFASDLNPVACLILKVMLEDIPRYGPALAEELRRVGKEIKEAAETELAELYPPDPDGARPIAYLWARTVRCETPGCGAEIPLVRSLWLSKKANRRRALRHRVVRPKGEPPRVEFEIFEPTSESEVRSGTVSRAKATCLCCGTVLPPERVRAQLAEQRGGADVIFDEEGRRIGGARLLAVVTLRDDAAGRQYRLPTDADDAAVLRAHRRLERLAREHAGDDLAPIPDEPTPFGGGSGAGRAFSVRKYGMLQWGDLFTARQKVALVALVQLLRSSNEERAPARSVTAIAVSRLTDIDNALCQWENTKTQVRHVFTRQALPILWDFAETSQFGGQAGDFATTLETVAGVIDASRQPGSVGQVQLADARSVPLPDQSAGLWFTDPPYYDAVPYADLSDFFFAWLKRALPGYPLLRDPFDPANPLTPKTREIVQDETKQFDGRPKDRAFFEESMGRAFAEGRRILSDDGIGCVVFAHKTTEGWEALLAGMVRGGWTITGSWPIATELGNRLRARDSAALATSVHLVCRPRPADAGTGDWDDVLRELPRRVRAWMNRLQAEGVRGADLVFACIGPALEIYSKYSRVETADGTEVPLKDYLPKVWEVVGRTALEQVLGAAEAEARDGSVGALEEDARLTALFLWTLQTTETHANGATRTGAQPADHADEDGEDADDADDDTGTTKRRKPGYTLVFDVVRRFAQPLGIHLEEWEGRIVETEKGVVRLLPVAERASQLFGVDGAAAAAQRIESAPPVEVQLRLFPEEDDDAVVGLAPRRRGRGVAISVEDGLSPRTATTLDRVHAAMLLQAGGRANALRALLRSEQERGPDFLRLANALSALYPRGSEEKRLVDAMLLSVPR